VNLIPTVSITLTGLNRGQVCVRTISVGETGEPFLGADVSGGWVELRQPGESSGAKPATLGEAAGDR
jgi:hypothetical protein